MQETWVRSLGWEDPLEEGKATQSSILAWRIPWTIKSMGSQRVGHDWVTFTLQDIGDRLNICTLKKKRLRYTKNLGFPSGLVVQNPPANARDLRDRCSIPGLGVSPVGGHGNPLQYSCLENPMDRGAWLAIVHRVAKSQIRHFWNDWACTHTKSLFKSTV